MKLVLTNDDGIEAPGLMVLEQVCREFGDLVIVAPESEQSYVGHRVTTSALEVEEIGPNRYRVRGTPADCARIALRCLAPGADWLISGVNRGGNLGADTYISGTVAAAREAAFLGYRAIAISQYIARLRPFVWDHSHARARQALLTLFERDLEDGRYWNVNLPHPENDAENSHIAFCELDGCALDVRYRREGSRFIYEGQYPLRQRTPGRDVDLCFGGHITATELSVR